MITGSRIYKKYIIVCFLSILPICCFHYFFSSRIEFVKYADGCIRIQDYAYYIIVAKKFWFEGFGNIYELSFQQQALSAYIGANFNYAMPLGITPLALAVWFPFAYLSRFSMALSYTAWIVFSCGVLFSALWRIVRHVLRETKAQLLPIALSFITLFSITMFRTVYLGQTSILATGIILHLLFFAIKVSDEPKSGINLLIAFSIFILGIKPTYLALGLGLLMIYGMWLPVIFSLVIITFCISALTPMLNAEWITSYFHQFSVFSREIIPVYYASAFAPNTMNIFRSGFRNIIGDHAAGMISTIVTCGTYIAVVGICILAKLKNPTSNRLSPLKVTRGQLFILIVSSYLLFAPYAGGYEDILILSVFITLFLVGNSPNLTNYKSIALICILFFILLHNVFPPKKLLWLFWTLKAVILGYMLKFSGFRKE